MAIYVKINGTWEGGNPTVNLCYHKSSGTWFQAADPKMYLKENVKYNFIDARTTTITVSVLGGYQEAITITGPNSYSTTVTCDTTGDGGTLDLEPGTYTLTSSYLTDTGLTRTVTVTSSTTAITSYPDSAIYWFGVFCFGATYSTAFGGSDYANRQVNINTDNIQLHAQVRSYPKGTTHNTYAAINFTNVDWSSYSNVYFYITTASSGTKGIGMSSSAGGNKSVTVTTTGVQSAALTTASYMGAKCYRVSTSSSTSFVNAYLTFKAVWME